MIQKFQNHLKNNFPFLENKDLLLATSSGVDSMVMVDLFKKLGYNFGMLHCNFKLRGAESDADMKFVMDYGDKYLIPWSIGHFETKAYAKEMKVSIQVAARELRYEWFEEQLLQKKFDFVLTAHHADDSLETFIINLSRGTGLDGLVGISSQNDKIIRPLLTFSRQEIEDYAVENKIIWREDSSNASDNYLRNKIRHQIVPQLKVLNSNFLDSFQKTQNYLLESKSLVEDAVNTTYQNIAKEVEDTIYFDIEKLKQLPNYESYLYQFLKNYRFSAWNDIYNLVDSQSGKIVYSKEYQIVKNRNYLILAPISESVKDTYFVEKNQLEVKFPINLKICKVTDIFQTNENSIFVDADKLSFPMQIRKWNDGDSFEPSGMYGKSKKISKFFKDEKISILEKQKIWILTSDNQIVWIIGLRQDERFKIEKTTTNKLQITYIQ